MKREYGPRYRLFLIVAIVFVAYNVLGMVVGVLASLPSSAGTHGDLHNVGHQAVAGDGTALSPPLFLLVIIVVSVVAATRSGWVARIGAFLVWLFAGFYLSAAELAELTTKTSPLSGAKWDLVLVLGSIGLAIAAAVVVTGLWVLLGVITTTRRARSASQ